MTSESISVIPENKFVRNAWRLHQQVISSGLNAWERFKIACANRGIETANLAGPLTGWRNRRIPSSFLDFFDHLSDGSLLRVLPMVPGISALEAGGSNIGLPGGVTRFFPRLNVGVTHLIDSLVFDPPRDLFTEKDLITGVVIQMNRGNASQEIVVDQSDLTDAGEFFPGMIEAIEFKQGSALQTGEGRLWRMFDEEVARSLTLMFVGNKVNVIEYLVFPQSRAPENQQFPYWVTIKTVHEDGILAKTQLVLHGFSASPSRLHAIIDKDIIGKLLDDAYRLEYDRSTESWVNANGVYPRGTLDGQDKEDIFSFLARKRLQNLAPMFNRVLRGTFQTDQYLAIPLEGENQPAYIPFRLNPVALQEEIIDTVYPLIDVPPLNQDPLPIAGGVDKFLPSMEK